MDIVSADSNTGFISPAFVFFRNRRTADSSGLSPRALRPGFDGYAAQLVEQVVSQGDVASPAGRQKTIEVFGEPLSPRQVVERICRDVATQGIDALLDYTRRIDGVALEPGALRVPAAAHPVR